MKKVKTITEHVKEIENSGNGFSNPDIGRKFVVELQKVCKPEFDKMDKLLAYSLAHSYTTIVK